MKFNSKYNRWFTKEGLVYRYNSKQDKLILCKQSDNGKGYKVMGTNGKTYQIHRCVYETFVGPISDGFEIDHINTVRDDNRIDNLRIVTHKDNMSNPLTRRNKSISKIYSSNTEFGKKYFEYYGYSRNVNTKQYSKERKYYIKHGKCRWE